MTIRDHMAPEVGGLGARKPRPDEIAKQTSREIKPGIVQGPDGKLSTSLPLPPLHPPSQPFPVWPFRIDHRDKTIEDVS